MTKNGKWARAITVKRISKADFRAIKSKTNESFRNSWLLSMAHGCLPKLSTFNIMNTDSRRDWSCRFSLLANYFQVSDVYKYLRNANYRYKSDVWSIVTENLAICIDCFDNILLNRSINFTSVYAAVNLVYWLDWLRPVLRNEHQYWITLIFDWEVLLSFQNSRRSKSTSSYLNTIYRNTFQFRFSCCRLMVGFWTTFL